MPKYYVSCDIKESTKMWKHKETEMIKAFLIEWYVICLFFETMKKESKVNYTVLGQYGDEWHIELDTKHDKQYVVRKLSFLVFMLKIFAERPMFNLKSFSKDSNLFRFGFSDKSIDEATKSESECDLDQLCMRNGVKSSMKQNDLDDDEKKTIVELQDQLISLKPFDNVEKVWCYYIFADKEFTSSKSYIKTKQIKTCNITMVSYKADTMKDFMKLVRTLDKNDANYCAVHGEVYQIASKSILLKHKCFLNPKDVYGDTVNKCAKEFIRMITANKTKNKDKNKITTQKTFTKFL